MRKTLTIYIILFFLSIGLTYSQRESGFKSDREKTFKNNGFKDNGKNPSKGLPPDPGGGGGNPIPISTGTLLLGIGLAGYISYQKLKKDAQ